jgi:two-component system NarL family sensor kinase
LPQRFELLVYRIVQELLNNIVKYADAKEVIIQLVKNENQFSIAIEDDGKGF